MKTAITAAAFFFSAVIAQAQGLGTPTEHIQSGDGTVGAMQAYTSGTATSPDDVMQQQRGRPPAAQGSQFQRSRVGVKAVFYAPGTVGAAPGSSDGR